LWITTKTFRSGSKYASRLRPVGIASPFGLRFFQVLFFESNSQVPRNCQLLACAPLYKHPDWLRAGDPLGFRKSRG